MVYTVGLDHTHGRIWDKKPTVHKDGLLTRIRNNNVVVKHGDEVGFSCVAFNATGESFATVDERGNLFVFHVLQNRYSLVKRIGVGASSVTFSPTRRNEVVVGLVSGELQCFDTESKTLLTTMKGHRSPVRHVSFHPTGAQCVTSSSEVSMIWNVKDWFHKRALSGAGDVGVQQVSYIGNGDVLLTVFRNDSVVAWDSSTFSVKYKLEPPQGERVGARAVAVSDDSRYLLTGGRRRTIALWNLDTRSLIKVIELPAEARAVVQLDWLGDSQTAVVLCEDGIARFVDTVTCRVSATIGGLTSVITQFAISPRRRYFAAIVSGGMMEMYDLAVVLDADGARPILSSHNLPDTNESRDSDVVVPSKTVDKIFDPRYFPDQADRTWTNSAFTKENADAAVVETLLHEGAEGSRRTRAYRQRNHFHPPPLYATAEKEDDIQLSYSKLNKLLLTHGEYPQKYRLLAWRFLLGLPECEEAYAALKAKGTHIAFSKLADKYPLKSRRLFKKLETTLSCLAYWSPVFAESPFIASFVFPFIRLLEHTEVPSFEIVMTVIVNYCQNWFEFHPNPPMNTLTMVENLLRHHDPALLAHFEACGITTQTYAWLMMQNAFSEVLSKAEWMKVFDHVFTNEPPFLLYFVVAYLRHFRKPLMDAHSASDYNYFFHRNNACNINNVLHGAYTLLDSTPSELHPDLSSFEPLVDGYPIFNKYPTFVVDFQAKEHYRIKMEEEDYLRKRRNIDEIERRIAVLEKDEKQWRGDQEQLLHAEEVRRQQAWKLDHEYRVRRVNLDAKSKDQRLRQIASFEDARRAFLDQQRKMKEAELARLEDDIKRKKENIEYECKMRSEEEALLKIEWQANQRMAEMEVERERAASAAALRTSVETRQKQDEIEEKVLAEAWKLEDEERRIKQRERRVLREKEAQVEEEIRMKRAVEGQYRIAEVEKELKLAQIQRERRLRQLGEDEAQAMEIELANKKHKEELLLKEENREKMALAAEERRWRQQQADEKRGIIERARRTQALELDIRAESLKELEKKQRTREFELALADKRRQERRAALEEERELHRTLASLEQERHNERKLEQMLLLKERETQEKIMFHRQLQNAEDTAVAEERQKLAKIREDQRHRLRLEEEEAARQHTVELTQMAIKRERVTQRKEEEVRSEVLAEERQALYRERKDGEQRLAERNAVFRAERAQLERLLQEEHMTSDPSTTSVSAPPLRAEISSDQDSASHGIDISALLQRQRENERKLKQLEEQRHRELSSVDDPAQRAPSVHTATSSDVEVPSTSSPVRSPVSAPKDSTSAHRFAGQSSEGSFNTEQREQYIASLKASAQEVLRKHEDIKRQLTQIITPESSAITTTDTS